MLVSSSFWAIFVFVIWVEQRRQWWKGQVGGEAMIWQKHASCQMCVDWLMPPHWSIHGHYHHPFGEVLSHGTFAAWLCSSHKWIHRIHLFDMTLIFHHSLLMREITHHFVANDDHWLNWNSKVAFQSHFDPVMSWIFNKYYSLKNMQVITILYGFDTPNILCDSKSQIVSFYVMLQTVIDNSSSRLTDSTSFVVK